MREDHQMQLTPIEPGLAHLHRGHLSLGRGCGGFLGPPTTVLQEQSPEDLGMGSLIDAVVAFLEFGHLLLDELHFVLVGHLFGQSTAHLLHRGQQHIGRGPGIEDGHHDRLEAGEDLPVRTHLNPLITPGLQEGVVRQMVVGVGHGFVVEGSKGNHQGNLEQSLFEAQHLGKFIHGIDAMDEQRLDLAGVHAVHQVHKFLVGRRCQGLSTTRGRREVDQGRLPQALQKTVEGQDGLGHLHAVLITQDHATGQGHHPLHVLHRVTGHFLQFLQGHFGGLGHLSRVHLGEGFRRLHSRDFGHEPS